MRVLGVWLVGLGITLLVMCVFPIAAAETPRALVGWLACAGLVPGSLIVLGIILVRRVYHSPTEETVMLARRLMPLLALMVGLLVGSRRRRGRRSSCVRAARVVSEISRC